jgi:hypothetical protein
MVYIKIKVFYNVTPYSLVDLYLHFRGICFVDHLLNDEDSRFLRITVIPTIHGASFSTLTVLLSVSIL